MLLGPALAASDALARLDARAGAASEPVREGLVHRLALHEAAGWLAAQSTWVHPLDLALRAGGRAGPFGLAAAVGRARTVMPNTVAASAGADWQAWAGLEYVLFRSGPVTSNVCEGGVFWYGHKTDPLPDLQYHFLPGAGVEAGVETVPGGNGCTLIIYQTRPRSRGFIELRDGDLTTPPMVNPGYLSDEYDLACLVEGVKIGQDMMSQPAISRHIRREHLPGTPLKTRAEYEAFVRMEAKGALHPTGACKMGTDAMAVVDPQLRVHGVDGLRVADTSIMPSVPSGNTNAPAIMVGERAADFIRGNRVPQVA